MRGRRIYGGVYELADGREVYLAWRKQEEIFRAGKKTVSDAVSESVASWAIDDETLLKLRREGVQIVGVLVRDTGDLYITTLSKFFTPGVAKVMDYESRGGALQRYLPLTEFGVRYGTTRFAKGRKRKA